jgi:hypothetical protein
MHSLKKSTRRLRNMTLPCAQKSTRPSIGHTTKFGFPEVISIIHHTHTDDFYDITKIVPFTE